MQDDEAAQQRCKPILHTNNVTWVATPEHGRKVVLITTKEAYCALAHDVLPPLSTHKLCTNRSFVLGDGRVSLRGWFGARGRGAQAQGSGIRTFLCTRVFRHTNRVSGQSRPWTVSTLKFIEEWFYSQGRVPLEQRLGTALQTAILLIISLSFSAVSQIRLT